MSLLSLEFVEGAVHFPALGLWLDRRTPCPVGERAFVSHAHFDHLGAHREVILSAPTARFMQERLPGKRVEHILGFGETQVFKRADAGYEVTLLPAGHILGSSMAYILAGGKSLLYSGDFKLRPGLSAEACQPRRADVLVMETTFGRPQYVLPPAEAVMEAVVRFCREALDNDETPVLLAYPLGKSQELLSGLRAAGFRLTLHESVWVATRIYEEFGHSFPPYQRYEAGKAHGSVVLCPPGPVNLPMMQDLGKVRRAVLTGWAIDPNSRYRYQCDAAFALSDHADFPALVEMVRRVQPNRIYTLHGFAADFAQTLREMGWQAEALGEPEQLALPLGPSPPTRNTSRRETAAPRSSNETRPDPGPDLKSPSFHEFALTCAQIAAHPGKPEKIRTLAAYFSRIRGKEAGLAAAWFARGTVCPGHRKTPQIGLATLRRALCDVAGIDHTTFDRVYLKHSDPGETTYELLRARANPSVTSLDAINDLVHRLQAARGPVGKSALLADAVSRCGAEEARWLVRMVTSGLRVGLTESLVEEALAAAFSSTPEEIRHARVLQGDIGDTATLAAEHQLPTVSLQPFRPVRFMVASSETTPATLWQRLCGSSPTIESAIVPNSEPSERGRTSPGRAFETSQPRACAWVEDNYAGVRCQLHKVGERVGLYLRDQTEPTTAFAEVANAGRQIEANVVMDGEIVAMRQDRILPFQWLRKRLESHEADLFLRDEIPVRYVVFDLLWKNGQSLVEFPLNRRRAALEGLRLPSSTFQLSHITLAGSAAEIEAALDAARHRGCDGLMVRMPDGPYLPGRHGSAWLTLTASGG